MELSCTGGILTFESPLSTETLYGGSIGREKFHAEIIEGYLSDSADVGKDGLAAIVTAGPPGAGKSTRLNEVENDLAGYRRLDADRIKDLLLEQAIKDGIFQKLLEMELPDGRPILPNELAVLVHRESSDLHNRLVERSMQQKVNIIVEGTLSWEELPNRYLGWLASQEYRKLRIIDVEVDLDTAKKQAGDRWWEGRQDYFLDRENAPLGGRFTPPSAIDYVYQTSQRASSCNTNAVTMYNVAVENELFDQVDLSVFDGAAGTSQTYSTRHGKGEIAVPLLLHSVLNLDKELDNDPTVKEV